MPKPTTIKKSYQEINEFIYGVSPQHGGLLGRMQDEKLVYPERTKLRYAIGKNLKQAKRLMADYGDKVEALNIKFAATDKEGVLILDEPENHIRRPDEPERYKYKPEDKIRRNDAQIKIYRGEVDFEPFYCDPENVPAMPPEDADVLMEFVLKERPPELDEPGPKEDKPKKSGK